MTLTALPDRSIASNETPRGDKHSALVIRNVNVHGRRTSIRLEPHLWDTLGEICRREFCTPHDVCSFAAKRKLPHGSLASSLRVVILDYFRTSSTEDGHRHAGHGQGMFMSEQLERQEMRRLKADGLDQ
jgi:predicted DNA-binding ribbon-helix-helix protein